MDILKELTEKVEKGKHVEAQQETQKAINSGTPPYEILINGLQPGLTNVGNRFKRGEAYIPEMLLAARAMQAGMDLLRPLLVETGTKPIGKVIIGTVKDDLHDIGKNMVGMMLEGAGFQVIDLGINVSVEKFVESLQKEEAPILGLSALLSTTTSHLRKTIEGLVEKGLRDKVKVIVGGAPVTEAYAMEIGADGYAPDAAYAVDKVKDLLGIEI
jgi:5-methyltetrahydrofolate--homocysteine methyltransferase